MPLILAPYTLGSQLPATAVAAGSPGYRLRQRWWWLASLVIALWLSS